MTSFSSRVYQCLQRDERLDGVCQSPNFFHMPFTPDEVKSCFWHPHVSACTSDIDNTSRIILGSSGQHAHQLLGEKKARLGK